MNKFAMHHAARKGDLGRVRQLIEAGVSVDSFNIRGQTPLHLAARHSRFEVAELLINSKCNINLMDRYSRTPAMLAAEFGRKDIVLLLLHRGALQVCLDEDVWFLLHQASLYPGWMDIASLILDTGIADLNGCYHGFTPLMWATIHGNEEVARLLIGAGASVDSVDERGQTALHLAASHSQYEVASLLINSNCNINAATQHGETPLMYVGRDGYENEEVAALLIRAGADVNRSNVIKWAPLHWAAYHDYTRVIQMFLEKEGLDLNPQDGNGNTPLHIACQMYHQGPIKHLLEAGADTNMKNNQGETALSRGIRRGCLTYEEIGLFVQKGAFLENCDYECISRSPFLRESILKNAELCTQSVVNKFNRQSLPALNTITYFARRLPSVDNFKLGVRQTGEVENLVKCDIKRNIFCNVVKVHPIALSALCVLSLITCQSGKKRAASPDFGYWSKNS